MGILGRLTELFRRRDAAPLDVAYQLWSCLDDSDSCEWCRSLEGYAWLPGVPGPDEMPSRRCTSRSGCRCIIVYVLRDELGAEETAALIRANGGTASAEDLSKRAEPLRREARLKSDNEHEAARKASRARQLEEKNPQEAMQLYRECIDFAVASARVSTELWAWRDVPYLFNRYTLLLERLRQFAIVLDVIAEFYSLPCQDAGTKADRAAIAKRQVRVLAKQSEI